MIPIFLVKETTVRGLSNLLNNTQEAEKEADTQNLAEVKACVNHSKTASQGKHPWPKEVLLQNPLPTLCLPHGPLTFSLLPRTMWDRYSWISCTHPVNEGFQDRDQWTDSSPTLILIHLLLSCSSVVIFIRLFFFLRLASTLLKDAIAALRVNHSEIPGSK